MEKIELLAPVGSMEALVAAIQNGCDAVYMGGKKFGARAYASNFDHETLVEAIHYAHGYGVKVYVTMNTLIYEDKMEEAIAFAKFLYENNVDAIILQDIGLMDVLHQKFPDLELHGSTQMHIHNKKAISKLSKCGLHRIVVPRETSMEEIQELSKLGVELEVFVQGAMCVSYSGQCLMSSKKLGRSGNQGECAQMCRMRYRLVKAQSSGYCKIQSDGEYLLSMKDLQTLNQIPDLIQANVASLKIEGRMKKPTYVAVMVKAYRQAIDAYYASRTYDHTQMIDHMKSVFHREYTVGHLFQNRGKALINTIRPNHIGIPIGTVVKVEKKRIFIKLEQSLQQFDGIRFQKKQQEEGGIINRLYHEDGRLIRSAEAQTIVGVDFDIAVNIGTKVVKTSDIQQETLLKSQYQQQLRRVPIYVEAKFQVQKPMQLMVWDNEGFCVEVTSEDCCEFATKVALSNARIEQQLSKINNTIFKIEHISILNDEKCQISISQINFVRRKALDLLLKLRQERTYEKRMGTYKRSFPSFESLSLLVSVNNIEQAIAAHEMGVQYVFLKQLHAWKTYHKQYSWLFYHGARVMKDDYPNTTNLCCEVSGLFEKDVFLDRFLNITNSYAAAFAFSQGCKGIVLSSECNDEQVSAIIDACLKRYGKLGNFYQFSYGREELMVMEYCPIHMLELQEPKLNCGLCQKHQYYLEDIKHNRYPLTKEEGCRMKILDYDITNQGVHSLCKPFFSFYDEDPTKVKEIIGSYRKEEM